MAVQGAGKVAYYLCSHLHAEGAKLIVTDIDAEKVKRVGGRSSAPRPVAPDAIYDQRGGHLRALRARRHDQRRDAAAAQGARSSPAAPTTSWPRTATATSWRSGASSTRPDYVINGGGVINVYGELHRWPMERAKKKAGEIYETLLRIFEIARRERIPTYRAADRLAEQRIAAVAGWTGCGWVSGRGGERRAVRR